MEIISEKREKIAMPMTSTKINQILIRKNSLFFRHLSRMNLFLICSKLIMEMEGIYFLYKKYDCDYVGFWEFIDIQIKREIFMR